MRLAVVDGIVAGGSHRHRCSSDAQRVAGSLGGIAVVRAISHRCGDRGIACADDGHLAACGVNSSHCCIVGAVRHAAVTCLRQLIRKGRVPEGLALAGRRKTDAAGGLRDSNRSTAGDGGVVRLRRLIVDGLIADIRVCRTGAKSIAALCLTVFDGCALGSRHADAVCLTVVGGGVTSGGHRQRGCSDGKGCYGLTRIGNLRSRYLHRRRHGVSSSGSVDIVLIAHTVAVACYRSLPQHHTAHSGLLRRAVVGIARLAQRHGSGTDVLEGVEVRRHLIVVFLVGDSEGIHGLTRGVDRSRRCQRDGSGDIVPPGTLASLGILPTDGLNHGDVRRLDIVSIVGGHRQRGNVVGDLRLHRPGGHRRLGTIQRDRRIECSLCPGTGDR